jgi:hypothetical protein
MLLALGIIIFSVHLGIFVFIYLPAALVFVLFIALWSRKLKRQKAMRVCAKCLKSLSSLPNDAKHCPYCGARLEETLKTDLSLRRIIFEGMEYTLTKSGTVLRRIIGLCCVSWVAGFSAFALMVAGLYAIMPLVIVLFFSPWSMFVLPCLLAGIYQLRVKRGSRKISLFILALGIVLNALTMFFVFRDSLGSDKDRFLFNVMWGSSLLLILNGLTCTEKISKKLLIVTLPTACLTVCTFSFVIIHMYYGHVIWNEWCSPFLLSSLLVTAMATIIAATTAFISVKTVFNPHGKGRARSCST